MSILSWLSRIGLRKRKTPKTASKRSSDTTQSEKIIRDDVKNDVKTATHQKEYCEIDQALSTAATLFSLLFVENPDRCRLRNLALSLKAFFEALVLGRMWTALKAEGRTVKSYKELITVYSATKMPSLGLTQTDLLCLGLASIPGGYRDREYKIYQIRTSSTSLTRGRFTEYGRLCSFI